MSAFKTYYKTELDFLIQKGKLIDEWSNVYTHCLTEGMVASVFARLLTLSPHETTTLIKAALLHDWYKRKEREVANHFGAQSYTDAVLQSAKLLREAGYSEEIILLIASVGHTSLQDIIHTDNFLRKLMHYIDDITLGDTIVGIDERVDELERAERYKELNESGRRIHNGKTYFAVQREVGHVIENEIAKRIGIKPEELIPLISHEITNIVL